MGVADLKAGLTIACQSWLCKDDLVEDVLTLREIAYAAVRAV